MKLSSLGLFWLFCSNLYLTKIVSYSPVYFAFGILCGALLFCLVSGKIKVTPLGFTIFLLLQYVVFYQAPLVDLNILANLIITLNSSFLIVLFLNQGFIQKSTLGFMVALLGLLFVLDGVWRFQNPYTENAVAWAKDNVLFYQYKYTSFMYGDSNFLGLQALALFCFFRFLMLYGVYFHKLVYPLLVLSIILTFSRASIMSMVFCEICYLYLIFQAGWVRSLVRIILVLLSGYAMFWLNVMLSSDTSLLSKFSLVTLFLEAFSRADFIDIVTGVGIGNAVDVMGIGAHNFYIVAVLEGGIIFASLFFILITYLVATLRTYSVILVVPIMINFFSLGTIAAPYILAYWFFGVMLVKGRLKVI